MKKAAEEINPRRLRYLSGVYSFSEIFGIYNASLGVEALFA